MNAQLKTLDPPANPMVQQRRKATQAKLGWLREQIDMRTRGLQWVEYKTAWSSGAKPHKVPNWGLESRLVRVDFSLSPDLQPGAQAHSPGQSWLSA